MQKVLLLLFLFIAAVITGCSGGSPSSNDNGNNVVSMSGNDGSVANGAVNTSRKPIISLQFAVPVNVSTVNSNNILLSTDSNGSNPIQISQISANNQANNFTFSPLDLLSPNSKYYVIVTKGVQSTSGVAISGVFSFSTSNDDIAPTVAVTAPMNNSTYVNASSMITINFSESVLNVTSKNVILREGSITGQPVVLGQIVLGANNIYSFSAAQRLKDNTTYYLQLSSGITDYAGNSLTNTQIQFTTGDFTEPTVAMLTPSNNSTGISKAPVISIKFSESVSKVDSNTVILREGAITGQPVALGSIVLGANNTYDLYPLQILKDNTTYYLQISNGITDSDFNHLSDTQFHFTTGDFTVPTVTTSSISNNQTNISTSPLFSMQFSEPVLNVNTGSILLREQIPDGMPIPIELTTIGSNNTYTFRPLERLKDNTVYYLLISSRVFDNANNYLQATLIKFTTGDYNAPTVIMNNPSNNSSGVSINEPISLWFSEPVIGVEDPGVVRLKSRNGSLVNIRIIKGVDSNLFTIIPQGNLSENVTYDLVLAGNRIKDEGGNSLSTGEVQFSFTTGDSTAPLLIQNSPINNESNVSINPTITLKFSEKVVNVDKYSINLMDSATGDGVDIGEIIEESNNTYTFSPISPLNKGSRYYVFLNGNGTITDTSGNQLSTTSFSFYTEQTSWKSLGTNVNTSATLPYITLNNLTPYVLYNGAGGQLMLSQYNATTNDWSVVGANANINFSRNNPKLLQVSPLGDYFKVYYQDDNYYVHALEGKPNSLIPSSWDTIPTSMDTKSAFSLSFADGSEAKIDLGVYIAYADPTQDNFITVRKFNGMDFAVVGAPGFGEELSDINYRTSISINPKNNLPVVAYTDINGTVEIYKYNGINWVRVTSFMDAKMPSVAYSSNGDLYLSYVNTIDNNIMVYRMSNGETSFTALPSPDVTNQLDYNLAVSNGMAYIATRGYSSNKAFVYSQGTWQEMANGGFINNGLMNPFMFVVPPDCNPFVAYNTDAGTLYVREYY